MKKLIVWLVCLSFVGLVIFCIWMGCAAKPEKSKPEILESQKIGIATYLYRFSFSGHTYIYLLNTWNSAGNQFLHDPGCECKITEK